MEKHNHLKRIYMCLLAVSLTATLLTGCQSKAAASNAVQTNNGTAQSGRKRLSAADRKKQIEDSIKPLVSAGTITQAQADKIVAAMTERNGAGNNQQGNQKNNQQNNQPNNQQNQSQNNAKGQRFNPLSKLVSDGTITQAQADAVMQKIGGNFSHNGNKQNAPNTGNKSGTSSN